MIDKLVFMIQLGRLEGFYWVARTQGYARAARSFPYPITQPGVHQQVKRLEAELGVRLFERVGKDRVMLTVEGESLYAFIAPFIEELPAVARALKGATLGGTLRIHAAGHLLRQMMPSWLKRLQRARPDIKVNLTEIKIADLELLRKRETDVLVDHLPDVPDDVEVQVIGKVHGFVVLPSGHRLARQKRVDLRDLRDETFISYQTPERRELQLKTLERHGVKCRNTYMADSADTILGFVAARLGFSLLPSLLPSGPRVPGVFSQRLTPPVELPIYAAWRKSVAPNPLLQVALGVAPAAT